MTPTAGCGSGTQRRTVKCVNSSGQVVPDSNCAATRPDETAVCNLPPCYSWNLPGGWGPCSNSCGSGTQTATVECLDSTGRAVDVSFCNPSTRPSSTRSCQDVSGCVCPSGPPANSTICSGTNTGLTSAVSSWTLVNSCGSTKCSASCNSGYSRNGNSCCGPALHYQVKVVSGIGICLPSCGVLLGTSGGFGCSTDSCASLGRSSLGATWDCFDCCL